MYMYSTVCAVHILVFMCIYMDICILHMFVFTYVHEYSTVCIFARSANILCNV